MTDKNGTVRSPSRITDYFPPSPKSCKDKESVDTKSEIGKDILSSSVLLTPESSPAKDITKESKTSSRLDNPQSENKCSLECQNDNIGTEENEQGENDDFNKKQDSSGKSESKDEVVKDSEKDRNDASSPVDDNNKGEKSESDSSQDQPKPSKPKQVHIDKQVTSKQKKGKGKSKVSQAAAKLTSDTSGKTRKKKSEQSNGVDNTLLTDFYPVRRSYRRTQSQIEKEKQHDLEDRILMKKEEGLEVQDIAGKGRGVVATKAFLRGDFVIEYAGDLIDISTAKKREEKYSEDPAFGCYMYYFVHKNKSYCVDATAESGRLGRLINHSKVAGNCHTKLIDINQRPYLILVASRDISAGEELLYDYGDRSKSSLESHPWLKS